MVFCVHIVVFMFLKLYSGSIGDQHHQKLIGRLRKAHCPRPIQMSWFGGSFFKFAIFQCFLMSSIVVDQTVKKTFRNSGSLFMQEKFIETEMEMYGFCY